MISENVGLIHAFVNLSVVLADVYWALPDTLLHPKDIAVNKTEKQKQKQKNLPWAYNMAENRILDSKKNNW